MPEALIARRVLDTARLRLQAPDVALAAEVAAFYRRNREHFARWDPPFPPAFYTVELQAERLARGAQAFDDASALRYWLSPRDAPARVIGQVQVSTIVRGAFQNGMLGYSLDQACEGRGLMSEALRAVIDEVFSPRVNLHRLQANHRPENTRSAAVLRRAGFREEGLARDYLFIDGAWRDHVMTALTNPRYQGVPVV